MMLCKVCSRRVMEAKAIFMPAIQFILLHEPVWYLTIKCNSM